MEKIDFQNMYTVLEKYYSKFLEYSYWENDKKARFEIGVLFGKFMGEFIELASIMYSKDLITNKFNFIEKYKKDLLQAIDKNNLLLIDILISSPFYFDKSLELNKKEISKILLHFLSLYEKNPHYGSDFKIGYFFEQFLEFLEYMEEDVSAEAIQLLDKILTLSNLSEDWYDAFIGSIFKLLRLLPLNNKISLQTAKQGLNIHYLGINLEFQDYLDEYYMKKGLVDKNYNWIGEE